MTEDDTFKQLLRPSYDELKTRLAEKYPGVSTLSLDEFQEFCEANYWTTGEFLAESHRRWKERHPLLTNP